MSKVNYCLDTNAVSDIIRAQQPVIKKMLEADANGSKIYISSVVYYETVRGLRAPQYARRLNEFYRLYSSFPHLYLDRHSMETIEKAAEIYDQLRHGQNVEDSDIFVAAIAIVNDCVLVTANEKHFCRIEGLRYVNWRR